MPAIQTAYNKRPGVGLPGLVVNMETQNSISRNVEEVAGIGFGLPVVQGVGARGILLPDSYAYAAAGSAAAGNTGANTITTTPATAAGVKVGRYVFTAISAGAAAEWTMEDPEGVTVGPGAVVTAVAFTRGGLGPVTIADPGTDAAVGDQLFIDVTATAGGGAFRGITILDSTLVARVGQTVDVYQKGNEAGLLTAGVIWGTAGEALTAGNQAYWNPATGRYTAATGYRIPNGTYDSNAAVNGDLVQVRVSHL